MQWSKGLMHMRAAEEGFVRLNADAQKM